MEEGYYVVRVVVDHLFGARYEQWKLRRKPPSYLRSVTVHRLGPTRDGRRAETPAMAWLRDELDGRGPVAVEAIRSAAAAAGLSPTQLERAKRRLGVKSQRRGFGPGGQWAWYLPDRLSPDPGDDPEQLQPWFIWGVDAEPEGRTPEREQTDGGRRSEAVSGHGRTGEG